MRADSNDSISEVAKDPQKGGADRAYQQLRSEVIGVTGSYDNDVARQRMADATADMVSNGVLPQMSAAWLKNEFSRIDTSGNGQIERAELEAAKEDQTRFGAFDRRFASTLDTELFDKLATYDQRTGEENISKSALVRYLRKDDRNNQKAIDQEAAKDALAPLYEGPDPLINYLNKDGNSRVSRREMKEFLEDYKKFQGTGPYTEENAQFVKDLMHRDIPELHTGITTGFSAKHTVKEMGLDSAHGRKHKDFSLAQEDYNNERPSERPPEPIKQYDQATQDHAAHDHATQNHSAKPVDNAIAFPSTGEHADKPAGNAKPADSAKPHNPDKAVGESNTESTLSSASDVHADSSASAFFSDHSHDRAKMQGWILEMERKFGHIKHHTHWGDMRRNFPHPRHHNPHPPFHPPIFPY